MNDVSMPSVAAKHLNLFRKSLPMRMRLQEIIRALGPSDGMTCLDVGAGSGVVSQLLRKNGGSWSTVVFSEAEAESVREVCPSRSSCTEAMRCLSRRSGSTPW